MKFQHLDRRRFLRGSGVALALPMLSSLWPTVVSAARKSEAPKRLACFYFPDGVPMPLPEDPAYQQWSWFPHGAGTDFQLPECQKPLADLQEHITYLSGFSHPAGRTVHGHNNADQFLTGAATGGGDMDYRNTISLDQYFAHHVGDQTRHASLVMSTDGGTGTARGAHTLSFTANGKPIPAEHRPKQVFDKLFVKANADAARQLAIQQSALDELLEDVQRLKRSLSQTDQHYLDEYLESVREAELRVAKAKQWLAAPLPKIDGSQLDLELTPEDPQRYVQIMYELIFLAFKTDSTRVATYQIGRENAVGISDHLARAVGFPLAHQLSHETKNPGGWKNFAVYCQFLNQEFARFLNRLKQTEEPGGTGSMLDHTLVLYGSASSAFHLSRNYPLILAGGKSLGMKHGQYLNQAGTAPQGGAWDGGQEPWQKKITHQDQPLGNVYLTMLQRLGVNAQQFAGCTEIIQEL